MNLFYFCHAWAWMPIKLMKPECSIYLSRFILVIGGAFWVLGAFWDLGLLLITILVLIIIIIVISVIIMIVNAFVFFITIIF